jgi:transcriptional regulator with XRE-family HTH domain
LVSDASENRYELARFLRSRRERLSPEQVGFPVGSRRRTSGLRREEVAILAGLSPTWYTYLEQGRKIQPSSEVLNSLARVLQLPEDERRYMHVLAFGKIIEPQPLEADLSEEALLRQIVETAADLPYPVYATNSYCDLIGWNRAASDWYLGWNDLPSGRPNLLRWLVTDPAAKKCLVDWERDARETTARWRAEIARFPGDRRMTQLARELREQSPDFARWWEEHDVLEHRSRIRSFRHPELGERSLRIVPMQSPHFTSAGVVFHLPVS